MDFTLALYIRNILFNGLQDTERIDIFIIIIGERVLLVLC